MSNSARNAKIAKKFQKEPKTWSSPNLAFKGLKFKIQGKYQKIHLMLKYIPYRISLNKVIIILNQASINLYIIGKTLLILKNYQNFFPWKKSQCEYPSRPKATSRTHFSRRTLLLYKFSITPKNVNRGRVTQWTRKTQVIC